MRFLRSVLLVSAGLPTLLPAQEQQDTTRLQELVVTATRSPLPADAVVSSVTTITGEELRARGVRFVQDAVRQVPGAMVVQGSSYGGVSSLFLRGGESDYVKVLIDGVPVNQSGGGYNWANLTTDNVERIEILRGPASVLYGSDAVTGVVQVFTRRGAAGLGVEGGAEAGSFGSILGQASVLGGTERINYSANASRIVSDGTYAFNNDYGNTVLSGSLHGSPDELTDVSLTTRFSDSRYHFPTDFSGSLADSNQSNGSRALSLAAEIGRRLGEYADLRFAAGGSRADGNFDDAPDSPGDTTGFAFASHRESRNDRGNLDLRLNAKLTPTFMLTTGGQVERETERQSGETTSNFGGIATTPDTPFDRGRTTFGYYVQGVLDLPSGWALNLNGRLDHNSGFGTFLTYRAGLLYRLASGTRVRASVGRAFKAPTFCEQYCDAPFIVGDSALQPEHSASWEAGLEQDVFSSRLRLWATYFDQRFRDLILYDGSAPPGEPTYFNGAEATARGVEVGVGSTLGAGVVTSASYTYLFTEATDDAGMPSPTFAQGAPLIRRPSHSAQLTLRGRAWNRATLGGSLTWVGSREDVDFTRSPSARVELPAYTLVNVAGELEILASGPGRPGVSGTLRVENLLDESYDEVVGFPGRPLGVFGGVRFQF
jgi:vitamin B12 transporter